MVDARLFQALSDPTRLRILLLLSRSTMNVTSIVNEVKAAQPAVSRHLRVLREASLINHVRKGKEVEYSLNLPQLRDANLYIEALAGGMGKGEESEVVELARPAAKADRAARGARVAGSTRKTAKKTVRAAAQSTSKHASRPAAKHAPKPATRPARREPGEPTAGQSTGGKLKEPGEPAAVASRPDYVVEREELDSMDDFLL